MTAKGIPEDTWPITLHMSSRYSQVDGVCFYWGCLDLQANNRSEWLPSSISSYFYRRGGNAITSYNNFFAKYSTTPMGHVWWYTPNPSFSRYECYDWITSAPCNIPVVTPTYDNSAYMTRQDPDNPYCIYYDFDTGAVGSFDARTGKVGCTGTGLSEFRMTGTETTTCSGKSVVATRESLTVVRVINGTAANMVLSVLNDDGAAVPGFVDVNVTIGTPVSLLGLTPNISGSNPSFNLNGDYSSTAVLEILFQYEARTMELCFNATTASSNATTAVPFTVTSYGNGTAEPIYPNSDTALDVCPA